MCVCVCVCVSLILNTKILYFYKAMMMVMYYQIAFICNRASSSADVVKNAESVFKDPPLRFWPWRQQISPLKWHSDSWWCITIQILVFNVSVALPDKYWLNFRTCVLIVTLSRRSTLSTGHCGFWWCAAKLGLLAKEAAAEKIQQKDLLCMNYYCDLYLCGSTSIMSWVWHYGFGWCIFIPHLVTKGYAVDRI